MKFKKSLPHGGNLYHYSCKYGIPEEGFIDFSASINPIGPPTSAVRALRSATASLVNYPDPDYSKLKEAISAHFGVPPDSVLAGNGSTEFIYLIPRALKAKTALVFAPTFSDYERAARLAGCKVRRFPLKEKDGFAPDLGRLEKALEGVDVFFLCNPNNPTGYLLEKGQVNDILKAAAGAGVFTVVDEAFIDYVPSYSVFREASFSKHHAVLRNFTKFYGMPGLRIGYMASHPSVIDRLHASKEPWSVNVLAELAAVSALSDAGYADKSLRLMDREKEFLFRELSAIPGVYPYRPSVNFMLVRLDGKACPADELAEHMASEGVLIRDCTNFRGLGGRYIRVAVRARADNERLVMALKRNLMIKM